MKGSISRIHSYIPIYSHLIVRPKWDKEILCLLCLIPNELGRPLSFGKERQK